jgi:hypothetical protein
MTPRKFRDHAEEIAALRDGTHPSLSQLIADSKPAPRSTCAVCSREVTETEQRQLDRDTDFVEHHGHLIRIEAESNDD